MTYLGWVLAFIVFDILLVLFLASRKPDSFRIERRAVFRAPLDRVFDQINDFNAWQNWSPWADKDPNAKATFGPVTAGKDAWFAWDGDKNVGKGRMTIIETERPRHVAFRLDFEAPFKATNRADFTLTPRDDGTEVVWAMTGPSPLMSKVMSLFVNIDRMVGGDFERGLERMRALVERRD